MDTNLANRLTEYADKYYEFMKLTEEEQQWIMLLLSRGVKTTIKILKLISNRPMTFAEIAEEVDCNPQTVTQKLNALSKGGFPIELTETSAFAPTGRPRKLARRT